VIGSPRDAGREAWEGYGAVREGVEGLEGGRNEGREEVPAHVARTGTLTSRGRIREGIGPRCTDGPSPEGEGVAGGAKDLSRCRPTLHGRARSRRGGEFERGSVHVARTDPLPRGKGWREVVANHVARMAHSRRRVGSGERGERRVSPPEETEENRLLQHLK
jgi:hypothetical protein